MYSWFLRVTKTKGNHQRSQWYQDFLFSIKPQFSDILWSRWPHSPLLHYLYLHSIAKGQIWFRKKQTSVLAKTWILKTSSHEDPVNKAWEALIPRRKHRVEKAAARPLLPGLLIYKMEKVFTKASKHAPRPINLNIHFILRISSRRLKKTWFCLTQDWLKYNYSRMPYFLIRHLIAMPWYRILASSLILKGRLPSGLVEPPDPYWKDPSGSIRSQLVSRLYYMLNCGTYTTSKCYLLKRMLPNSIKLTMWPIFLNIHKLKEIIVHSLYVPLANV